MVKNFDNDIFGKIAEEIEKQHYISNDTEEKTEFNVLLDNDNIDDEIDY